MTALRNSFEETTALFEAMVPGSRWRRMITEGDVDYPMWLWPAGRRWNLQSVGFRGGLPRQRLRLPS